MRSHGLHAAKKKRKVSKILSAVVAAAIATVGLGSMAPARAAGNGVLSVSLTAVDVSTGLPLNTVQAGTHENAIKFIVNYSCATADCDGTSVQLSPPPLDPGGIVPSYTSPRGLIYNSGWTPPPGGGATIAGDAAGGVKVTLGNLAAGTSSQFNVTYLLSTGLTNPARPSPASFFPDGYTFSTTATISSPTAVADATDAAPFTFHLAGTPNPGVVADNPGAQLVDTTGTRNVSFQIRFATGAMAPPSGGNIRGDGNSIAAKKWTVTDVLPAEATFVQARLANGAADPTFLGYDVPTHTLTWSSDPAAAGSYSGSNPNSGFTGYDLYNAAGGWGSTSAPNNVWNTTGIFQPRSVTVNYAPANFANSTNPPDANGCNFANTVTNTVSASVTYMDPASTVKNVGPGTQSYLIQCWAPFSQASMLQKDTSNNVASVGTDAYGAIRGVWIPIDTTGLTCPASGRDDWGRTCTPGNAVAAFGDNTRSWVETVYNEANVPSVAVVTDNNLSGPAGTKVYGITAGGVGLASVAYTLNDGTMGVSNTNGYGAPAGKWITAATVTTNQIPPAVTGGNNPTHVKSGVSINYNYTVSASATPGATWTNTVSAKMQYPANVNYPYDNGLPEIDLGTTSRTLQLIASSSRTTFTAAQAANPVIAGGGTPTSGTNVTFSMTGNVSTSINGGNVGGTPDGHDITPEYTFFAPVNWTIPQGTPPTFTGTVPAGVVFHYGTGVIGGQTREYVTASWPNTVTFGNNGANWPAMNVVAQPTSAAGGTTGTPAMWISDSRNQYTTSTATFNGAIQNTADVNGDGQTTQWFASAAGVAGVPVGATASLSIVKSICKPDASQPGGCSWISNPGSVVTIPTSTTSVHYRIKLTNSGSQAVTNAVIYDVLPYIGDKGTIQATSSSSRGSTFSESFGSWVGTPPASMTYAYSASTNPCRNQIYADASNTTCVNDWSSTSAGAKAIRATAANLAVGASVTLEFNATLDSTVQPNQQACNSVAVASTQTIAAEPQAVCASTGEADLAISVPNHLPLQAGRTGSISFNVVNNGGAPTSPATVTVDVPSGVSVTNLSPTGYSCATAGNDPAPVAGAVTLTCTAVTAGGQVRSLALDASETLTLPVDVDDNAAGNVCFEGAISGPLPDPVMANNTASYCATIATPKPNAIALIKDDGVTSVKVGDQTLYALTVSNPFVSEALSGAVLTDTLPADVQFVSASNGGTLSGNTVTWNLPTLAAAGVPNSAGSTTSGAAGSSITVTVKVKVLNSAINIVKNVANVTASDPADASQTMTGTDQDIDVVNNIFTGGTSIVTPQNTSVDTPLASIVQSQGAPIDVTSVTQKTAPAHGSISIENATGKVTYTPSAGYSGPDQYTVNVCDTSSPQQCVDEIVKITVGVNTVTTQDKSEITSVATPVTTNVLALANSGTGQPLANPTVVAAPANGTTTVNGGSIKYTPANGFSGTDSYKYRVCDTSNPAPVCSTSTVSILVNNVFTGGANIATPQNTAITTPLATIAQVTGKPLNPSAVSPVTNPAHGAIAVQSDGSVKYTPANGYTGPDSYVVKVCDTSSPVQCANETVNITVQPNVVTAVDDADSTSVGVAVTTNVKANDNSASGQSLGNPSVTTAAAHGTTVVNANGSITYTPSAGFSGLDTYKYGVCDTGTPSVCDTATVTITVKNVITGGTSITTPQNQPKTALFSAIAQSTGMPLDGSLTTKVTDPAHGSILIDGSGNVTYTPAPGYSGPDSFVVNVCDTSTPKQCADETVTVTVQPNVVTAANDIDTTPVGTPVTTDVRDNDTSASGQSLASPTVTSAPANGATSVVGGSIQYTPDAGFSGVDSYVYEVCDTGAPSACDSAIVTITVKNVFTPGPGVTTPQNQPVITSLSGIATTSGKPLNVAKVTQVTGPEHGTISIDGSGNVTYEPEPGYSGPDSYTVNVCDTSSPVQCADIDVPVTVQPNTVTAVNDNDSTTVGTAVTTEVKANDTSASTQALGNPTVRIAPVSGVATGNPDGTITYTPNPGFSGTDSYGYELCDTSHPVPVCDTATVVILVNNVFTPGPGVKTGQNKPITTPTSGIVTTTGKPVDPTKVTQTAAPKHGKITVDPVTGGVTYTPDPGYSGPDSYEVNVCDTSAPVQCSNVTVPVTVGPNVLTGPNYTQTIKNGGSFTIDVLKGVHSGSGQKLGKPVVSKPKHGTAKVNPNGTVSYQAKSGFKGTDVFKYTVCDTGTPKVCVTRTVTVHVKGAIVVPSLPNTGGPSLALLLGGSAALLGGFVLMMRGRRRA